MRITYLSIFLIYSRSSHFLLLWGSGDSSHCCNNHISYSWIGWSDWCLLVTSRTFMFWNSMILYLIGWTTQAQEHKKKWELDLKRKTLPGLKFDFSGNVSLKSLTDWDLDLFWTFFCVVDDVIVFVVVVVVFVMTRRVVVDVDDDERRSISTLLINKLFKTFTEKYSWIRRD